MWQKRWSKGTLVIADVLCHVLVGVKAVRDLVVEDVNTIVAAAAHMDVRALVWGIVLVPVIRLVRVHVAVDVRDKTIHILIGNL